MGTSAELKPWKAPRPLPQRLENPRLLLRHPQDQGPGGLRRIEILCAAPNIASQRVPQKLGLQQEARRRQTRFIPGHGWVDQLGWGVLIDEWDSEHHRLR